MERNNKQHAVDRCHVSRGISKTKRFGKPKKTLQAKRFAIYLLIKDVRL